MVALQDWFYDYNNWSFTKHNLWSKCRRAYYYSYIGTALKDSQNLDVPKLKGLKKNLISRYALKGKLVHEVIENQINQFHRSRMMDERTAREQYSRMVDQYRRGAKEKITEYFNGEHVDEIFFNEILASGHDQISRFMSVIWPQIRVLNYLQLGLTQLKLSTMNN